MLDLTNLLPGPYAAMVLGDFGADVIKVEKSGGDPGRWSDPAVDGVSARHRMVNRNKRSVVLDLKGEQDREVFLELVRDADVLLEGFRPGVMDRLDLGFDRLTALSPRLVYCAISGYGQQMPGRAGHDLNFMAEAGLLPTHAAGGAVPLPNTQYADLVGGSMRAVVGILLALRERDLSGRGQFVDVAMSSGALHLQVEMVAYRNAGQPTDPSTTRLTGAYPCYQLYPTSDDRLIAVSATEAHFWRNLCELLELPELLDQQYAKGPQARAAMAVLTEKFSERPYAHWAELLEGTDTCTTPVLSFEEAMEVATSRPGSPLWQVDDTVQLAGLVELGRTPARYRRPAPALVERTDGDAAPRWLGDSAR